MPTNRDINLVIHNWQKQPKNVNIANQQTLKTTWREESKTLTISFSWQHQPLSLLIE